jgi:hypothetical protein
MVSLGEYPSHPMRMACRKVENGQLAKISCANLANSASLSRRIVCALSSVGIGGLADVAAELRRKFSRSRFPNQVAVPVLPHHTVSPSLKIAMV